MPNLLQLKLGPLHFVLRDDEHTSHLIFAQLIKNTWLRIVAGFKLIMRPMSFFCIIVQWILPGGYGIAFRWGRMSYVEEVSPRSLRG